MRLAAAGSGDVVRNTGNGSHYRFDRVEKSKARIRPLEMFPSGRLMPKPTDTLVSADIDVVTVGPWVEGLAVVGGPAHAQPAYEQELRDRVEELVRLEAEYEQLPQSGVGKLSRGSFANKVKNCRARILTLETGLGLDGAAVAVAAIAAAVVLREWAAGDVVQVPSGRPGLVLSNRTGVALVRTAVDGVRFELPLPAELLRPWAQARLATM